MMTLAPTTSNPGNTRTPERVLVPVYSPEREIAPVPDRITIPEGFEVVPSFIPSAPESLAAEAGLFSSSSEALPPPMVMSAPLPETVVSSCVKFPKATPPVSPVVQNVIRPLEVLNCLGKRLVPASVLMRPADLTRIPALPEVMLEFKVVVAADSASMDTELPAVIGPFPELPTVMFPEAESLTVFAEIVALLVLRVDDPPDISTVPTKAVNAPPPEKVVVGRMFTEPFEVVTAVVWVTADP
jgi:hypothetical protein